MQCSYAIVKVICYSEGGSRSGLFCVLDSTTERMDTEIEVDLFNSVIRARTAQPHFIPSQVGEFLTVSGEIQ